MKIFDKLRHLRHLQKQYLPQLQTIEDFDIVRGIGYHQDIGTPVTLKLLLQDDIGSVATVQRRLRRLMRQGVVLQSRAMHDRRNRELTISPEIRKAYKRKEALLDSA